MSERTPVKAERNAAIAECRGAGMTILAISRRFHVSEARVGQILKAAGVLNARPVRVLLPSEFPSISAAAAAYGVKRDTVYRWIARGIATTATALVLAACCGGAEAHENNWYGGLHSPTGVPCCNDRDCRRLDACTLPGGRQGVAANGGCWPVPYDKVLPGLSSPDGEMHGCFPNSAGKPVWLCFVMPGSA